MADLCVDATNRLVVAILSDDGRCMEYRSSHINLLWYGSYLSFPLFGEDGAALYSSLVETVRPHDRGKRHSDQVARGMGQPNIFETVTFDPFSWLMLTHCPQPMR